MPLPLYLALTPPEISGIRPLPRHFAYMACHFSSSNPGISNLPRELPDGAMLILNDSNPVSIHDPEWIAMQMAQVVQELNCDCVLLDFQRPYNTPTVQIAEAILSGAGCPVAVSHLYARGLDCPVFLPPLPHTHTLKDHISQWKGREIWLEVVPDTATITVTRDGSQTACGDFQEPALLPHHSSALHCHYKIQPSDQAVQFILQRTPEDICSLLDEAATLGIGKAVGLYQELEALF